MKKSTGDSADPRSTGVFKAARIHDEPSSEARTAGCGGCFVGPVRLTALAIGLSLFALTPITALIVLGWSLQLCRRVARWRYWGLQPTAYRGDGFVRYAKTRGWLAPPWIPPLLNHWYPQRAVAPRWLGGGWRHFKVGFVCWLHSTIWCLPVIVLWAGAHRRGWRGTIPDPAQADKQLFVGSLAMILLLAAVMRVLPLLQARYSFTHDWRVFYDWRTVLRLNYLDPAGGTWLAVLYGLAAHLLYGAANLTVDASGWVYRGAWMLLLFAAVLLWTFLRLVAIWIYPRVLRDALANDMLTLDGLHPMERELIQTLSWSEQPAQRSLLKRAFCILAPIIQLLCWSLTALIMAAGIQQTQTASGTLAQHPLIHVPWIAPAAPK